MGRILIIEDNEGVRDYVTRALKSDHDVVAASDGEAGLEAFREKPFDLVITDIFMPSKDGIETIREIRRISLDVKIIAVSGGGGTEWNNSLKAAEMLGASHCLAKPFTLQQLYDAVRTALAEGAPPSS